MLYIAAWQGNDKKIWYEYTSKHFCTLFGCEQHEIADVFRESVEDRCIYKNLDLVDGVHKQVKTHAEISNAREELREEGKKTKTIEAVYRVTIGPGKTTWLKRPGDH